MFQVGQFVVQKKDCSWGDRGGDQVPVYGVVYTIRSIETALDGSGDLFLTFEEIRNPPDLYEDGYGEVAWDSSQFRPLSSDRLSIFRQHLAPLSTDKVEA